MCKLKPKNKGARIDFCMINLIKFVRAMKYQTLACCCGHGKYPMTIIVKSKWHEKPFEILSKTYIPRNKRFYKRDSQGYYYIPEVLK